MRNIEQALQEHKQVVLDAGYPEKQIFGVFLYGSQNYKLDTENSDVDTKVVIIPTLKDLCQETLFTDYKWINPIYDYIWGELMNIRNFIAYYDMNKAVQSMGHQALHTLKQNSANPKKFAMATYIAHFLSIYMEGHLYNNPYEIALKPEPHLANYLVALKTGEKDYTAEDVIKLRKELEKIIEKKFHKEIGIKNKIDEKLLEIAISAIKFFDNL